MIALREISPNVYLRLFSSCFHRGCDLGLMSVPIQLLNKHEWSQQGEIESLLINPILEWIATIKVIQNMHGLSKNGLCFLCMIKTMKARRRKGNG